MAAQAKRKFKNTKSESLGFMKNGVEEFVGMFFALGLMPRTGIQRKEKSHSDASTAYAVGRFCQPEWPNQ